MRRALERYLQALWRHDDHAAAVVAAAEAEAGHPWDVVRHAGLLSRCRVAVAEKDLGLTSRLGVREAGRRGAVATVPAGAPYPQLAHPGRRRRGAFDTPADMARRVVAAALSHAEGEVQTGLDAACGPGSFLVAMLELGVPRVLGTDLDPLAVQVARVAAPGARVEVADALHHGEKVDLVVGNPPYVPPERQDKALRASLRRRFPWLRGRFDLVVPFAAVAAERARPGGGVGLVLPFPSMVQPYGATLRRRWVERHRIASLSGPHPFPGAAVEVALLVLVTEGGPAPLPPHGLDPAELCRLEAVPLDPTLRPGDVDLVEAVRARSVPLGRLCLVDTGLVAHGPGGGKARLLRDEPGEGRVPYADAKGFFAGETRWLEYRPELMHRAKSPAMFESDKIVVQRLRGKGPVRAAIDRAGTYLGHTCTVVLPREAGCPPLERLLHLIRSPLVDGLVRIERGQRLDLYPRDVAAMPVPTAWLQDPGVPLEEAWALTEGGVARLGELSGRRG